MIIVSFLRDHMSNTAGSELGFESREAADLLVRQGHAKIVREQVRVPDAPPATPEITAAVQRWRAANGFAPIVAAVEPAADPKPVSVPPAASPALVRRKG